VPREARNPGAVVPSQVRAWGTTSAQTLIRQAAGDVDAIGEAVADGEVHDAVIGVVELVNAQPVGLADVRDVLGLCRDDDDVLVQDLVVLHVRPQGQWRRLT